MVIRIKGKIVPLADHLIEIIESMTEEEKAQARANLDRKLGGQMFSAKSMMTRMTLDSLMQGHKRAVEDVARYRAQILEAGAFLRSVADHLVLIRSDDFFTNVAVEASISSVADAFECVTAEEPQEALRVVPWRSWRSSGIYVN
jgi:hypothetical protein